jgi:hypothetical protein
MNDSMVLCHGLVAFCAKRKGRASDFRTFLICVMLVRVCHLSVPIFFVEFI